MKRLGSLLTVMVAMVIACAGVVLAQPTEESAGSAKERAASKKEAAQSTSSQQAGRIIPDQYIVVLKDRAELAADGIERARAQEPAQVASELSQLTGLEARQTYRSALKGFSAEIQKEQVEEVRSDPRVKFVVPDREVRVSAQTLPAGINRVEGDQSSTQAGNGSGSVDVDIAVIDTGIYKHPDLNVAGGKDCSPDGKNTYSDDNGHGTHVAGTAAAKDNAGGVVGVAPGARLWAVKVLKANGVGSASSVICGIDWVTENASTIEVTNMSIGGASFDEFDEWIPADDGDCGNRGRNAADAEHLAICASVEAGMTYAVAAGNETDDAKWYSPAAFDEVMTVSALADYNGQPNGGAPNTCNQDQAIDDDFAFFSNYGSDVDLAAPGVCIKSTWFVKKKVNGKRRTVPSYKTISGTSMASPHVAGGAALYKIKNPTHTPSQVLSGMTSAANSEAKGAGHTDFYNLNSEPLMLVKNY